eukprot:scaffold11845_cov35-Phaeocystis_antarctica.AAC.1
MPHWSFSKVTTGTAAMAASATISVTTCACHLNDGLRQAGQAPCMRYCTSASATDSRGSAAWTRARGYAVHLGR